MKKLLVIPFLIFSLTGCAYIQDEARDEMYRGTNETQVDFEGYDNNEYNQNPNFLNLTENGRMDNPNRGFTQNDFENKVYEVIEYTDGFEPVSVELSGMMAHVNVRAENGYTRDQRNDLYVKIKQVVPGYQVDLEVEE